MKASPQDVMTAKLFMNAAFPVMQVLIDDDPKLNKKFAAFHAVVQFSALDDNEPLFCHLIFDGGKVTVVQGKAPAADLALTFSGIAKMNALLKGGMSLPSIKGKLGLLPNVLSLLLGLKIMTKDNAKLVDPAEKALKVKCSLYMITRALSQYNKLGNPEMQEFCQRQPDRIYQFKVEQDGNPAFIAAYLRVKAGKSKSGHGVYERRSPFVLFRFTSVDGALKILDKEVQFVEGVEKGYVETIGSPEYAMYLNDYMAVLQGMLT